jgi:hypothetical protein
MNLTQQQLDDMQSQIDNLTRIMQSHNHGDSYSQRISLYDITNTIQSSSTSAETTARTSNAPSRIYEQIFIDTSTATKKLYIYDAIGHIWYSVTIA